MRVTHPKGYNQCQNAAHGCNQESLEPPGLPKIWQHDKGHTRANLIPDAVAVCGQDSEAVAAGEQRTVTDRTLVHAFAPLSFCALKLPFASHLVWRGKIDPSESKLDVMPARTDRHGLIGRSQLLSINDGFKLVRHAVHAHFLDDDGRRAMVHQKITRID